MHSVQRCFFLCAYLYNKLRCAYTCSRHLPVLCAKVFLQMLVELKAWVSLVSVVSLRANGVCRLPDHPHEVFVAHMFVQHSACLYVPTDTCHTVIVIASRGSLIVTLAPCSYCSCPSCCDLCTVSSSAEAVGVVDVAHWSLAWTPIQAAPNLK